MKQKTTSTGVWLDVIYITSNFSLLIHQPYSHGWLNTIKLSKHFLQINVCIGCFFSIHFTNDFFWNTCNVLSYCTGCSNLTTSTFHYCLARIRTSTCFSQQRNSCCHNLWSSEMLIVPSGKYLDHNLFCWCYDWWIEPPNGFDHEAPGLGIQHLNH